MRPDPGDSLKRLSDLFEQDREALLGFLRKKLYGDVAAEADDLLSDVVLRLVEKADLLAQIEDLTAYVYGALSNAVIDLFRRRKNAPAPLPEEEDEILADPAPDPEMLADWHQQEERFLAALERLSPPERAVWIAHELDGASFRDLAEAWDEPIGTLLARKNRAGKKLRAWMTV